MYLSIYFHSKGCGILFFSTSFCKHTFIFLFGAFTFHFFFTVLCLILTKKLLFPFQDGSLFSFSVSFFRCCCLLLLLCFPSLTCHLAHQVMLILMQLSSFLPSIRKVCRMPFFQGSLFSCIGCNFYFCCCLFTPASKDYEKWCLA